MELIKIIAGIIILIMFPITFVWAFREEKKPEDIQCPVCGYYCLGKGGHGCIDKPSFQITN